MNSWKNLTLTATLLSIFSLAGCSSDDELPEVSEDFTFSCADYSQALAQGKTSYARKMLTSAKTTLGKYYTEDTIPQGYYREYLTRSISGIIMTKEEVTSICASNPSKSLLNAASIAANNSYQTSLNDLNYSICAHLNSGHTSFDDFLDALQETKPDGHTMIGTFSRDYISLMELADKKDNDDFTDNFLEESVVTSCSNSPFKSTFAEMHRAIKIATQKTRSSS